MKKGDKVRRVEDNFRHVRAGEIYTVSIIYPNDGTAVSRTSTLLDNSAMISLEGVEGLYLASKFEVLSNRKALPEWF